MVTSAKKNKFKDVEETDDFFSSDSAPSTGTNHEDREIDGWYEPEQMVIVAGLLVGVLVISERDEKTGVVEDRRVALIELKRPIRAKLDETPLDLVPGQVLAVGERAKLAPLFTYEKGAKVWFRPTGKKELSGKRSPMWKFEIVVDGKQSQLTPTAF